MSLLCTGVLIVLSASEVRDYAYPNVSSSLEFQTEHHADKVKVNIDMEWPYIPCDIISLDIEDSLGYHISDYYGEMHKQRLSKDGEILSTENWTEKMAARKPLFDRVEKELKSQHGCRLKGYIEVQRVPGNFHVGHHSFSDVIQHYE